MAGMERKDAGRGETINLRASQKQKVLIDRAAEALGRSRSDFMLDSVCREAERVLLDRRYFDLPPEAFKRFTAMLDKPPATNPKLRRLLQTRSPWDE
ncbi:type II toxin-antitoxin system TacA family antitoxin [Nitrospira sp. Nam80]